jgi:hypothetical protein
VIPESDALIGIAEICTYLQCSVSYFYNGKTKHPVTGEILPPLKERFEDSQILFTRTRRGWHGRRIHWTFAHLIDVWLMQAKHV